jgi:protein AATF/BFR2
MNPPVRLLTLRTVTEKLAESAQSDAEKGRDIKLQQKFYDTLLDARIRLQKALLATNSLPVGESTTQHDEQTVTALQAAKQEALNLFASTHELRKVRLFIKWN